MGTPLRVFTFALTGYWSRMEAPGLLIDRNRLLESDHVSGFFLHGLHNSLYLTSLYRHTSVIHRSYPTWPEALDRSIACLRHVTIYEMTDISVVFRLNSREQRQHRVCMT